MKEQKTKWIEIDRQKMDIEILKEAGEKIRQGELIAFPTETVYGLGADALNPDSTEKIYQAKGRPSDNPLIIHIAEYKEIQRLGMEISPKVEVLAKKFWPGPLTMILKKHQMVPYTTTGGLDTVAIRIPDDKIARMLIRYANTPIAAPSANTSGRPSPTKAEHVYEDMQGKISMLLDGGEVGIGLESTIIDMTLDPPEILRPGAITKEMLEREIGKVVYDEALMGKENIIAKAPGMKYRHYAPNAKLIVIEGESQKVVEKIQSLALQQSHKKIGIIATQENAKKYRGKHLEIRVIAAKKDTKSIAHNLFAVLRDFDTLHVDMIYSESFAGDGLRLAIMNRLMKASGQKKIEV